MKKTKTILLRCAFFVFSVFLSSSIFAQTKISGKIIDSNTKETLAGVNVAIKGRVIGTTTDAKGNFQLNTSVPTPFTVSISFVGYSTQEVEVNGDKVINIGLSEQAIMGQEVVVSASRIEESVMKSPVTVEKMDIRGIKETPSASFYDGLANMKGIDMATQGLLFKSINMRGFGATGNPRTVQMIDGMDNSAPGLNFPVDNIVGMPELDVESVEILPGAASALYGPNALNGLVLMNSKSPFLYQGLSAAVKAGVMSASNRDTKTTPYTDVSFRYAKAINDKFAFKINLGLLNAKDWQSTNYENLNLGGNNPNRMDSGVKTDYDGMNSYGDEIQRSIGGVNVSRTGYLSKDLINNEISSFKFNGALHYRLSNKVEAIAQLNYGLGSTPYTGTGQYNLLNFKMTQAKLELRGDNFMLRGYTTQENSGESYAVGLAAQSMIRTFKSDDKWFADYTTGGRALADAGMPQPGTAAYATLLKNARTQSINLGGGNFEDKTNLYHLEGNYNFKNQIKFVELLVGGNLRRYNLKSNGTLFSDKKEGRSGVIPINEYGAYAQLGKQLGSFLKLTASMRYDKNENFDGQFSPRVSAVSSFGSHNIRVSYQTGFRIPTTQNQYIDLAIPGSGTLIGGLPEFDPRYKLTTGVDRNTLVGFSLNPTPYITPDVLAKSQAYATAAVTAAIPQITAGVTAAVTAALPQIQAGVTAAVQEKVTAGVTAAVNAAVAAGQLPAANAAAAIAAGVATQMASDPIKATIQENVTATVKTKITEGVQATVVSQVTAVTKQVAPGYALATLPKYKPKTLIPEKINSFEIGYKVLLSKRLFVDASYYNSIYKNFIGGVTIVVPTAALGPGLPIESGLGSGNTRAGYSRPANSEKNITVTGFSLSANYSLAKGYNIGGNFANNQLKDFVPTAEVQFSGFNTPKNRYNINFGKRLGSGEKVGFNIAMKHQDSFTWQSSFDVPTTTAVPFYSNTIVPAITNLDAQVSFKAPSIKSIIKVGGTNLFGKPYFQAYGSASTGSMYYVSVSFDQLFNK
jgi:iron complex outermembrane recepter protein